MSYDLETERGVIENAMGQTLDEYLFWAKSAEKIGVDKVRLKSATVTTCTQPVPYWSFSVSSATIRIDNYARMWNVRLKAGRAPLIYHSCSSPTSGLASKMQMLTEHFVEYASYRKRTKRHIPFVI